MGTNHTPQIYTKTDPWAHLFTGSEGDISHFITSYNYASPYLHRLICGHRSQTKSALLHECAAALQFGNFGHNWDALHECIRDFDWFPELPGFVLCITRCDQLLLDDKELNTFIEILHDTARYWRFSHQPYSNLPPTPPKAFNVIFQHTEGVSIDRLLDLFQTHAIAWEQFTISPELQTKMFE